MTRRSTIRSISETRRSSNWIPVQESEPGQYRVDLSIDAVENEAELANNQQTVFCEVMKRRIRVLVLEGQPFWDTKFLAESLRCKTNASKSRRSHSLAM